MGTTDKQDHMNRNRLKNLFEKAETFIKDMPLLFKEDLESWAPQYENHLKSCIQQVHSNQCVLLVAGEIGSGKSSLINLLLGLELLPTSELQCTETIVEISYGAVPKITANYHKNAKGEATPSRTIKPDPSESSIIFLDMIKTVVTTRDENTDESPYESVQVEYPIQLLQGGVTIVDCPGVEATESVSPLLLRYLEKAFGFLCVINSSVNIHRHRLGQLLLKSVEAHYGFDQNTMLFICNHWDKIPQTEASRVLEETRKMLEMILPVDTKVKLYPISLLESLQSEKDGKRTEEHQQLLKNFHKFVPQCRSGRLRMHYRYLSTLLKRVLYSFRISFNLNKENIVKVHKSYKRAQGRFDIKQRDPKERTERIRREVKRKQFDASHEILQYLNATANRSMLTTWEVKDCPKKQFFRNVVKQANAAIAERVGDRINMWEERSNFLKSLDDEIIQLFKDQFQLVDEEIKELQETLQHGSAAKRLMMDSKGNRAKWNQGTQFITTNDKSPSIGSVVTSSFNLATMDMVKDIFNKKYSTKPCKVMRIATELYLDTMMNNINSVAAALTKYFQGLLNSISEVGPRVQDLMKADIKLLKQLKEELQRGSHRLIQLPEMDRQCKEIIGELDMFYVQRLIVPDFSPKQITYLELLGCGSFAKVYSGILRRGYGDEKVALKEPLTPIKTSEITDVLLEESMLRSLKHSNIVQYFGMFKKEQGHEVKLVFVMEYCPFTLKEKCINADESPSSLGKNAALQKTAIMKMTKYVTQITKALVYLHHKSIAHRDLKPENVLISDQDDARIADLGLAKKVKDIATCQIGTPVYMAPEVLLLQNVKYGTKVDIYSLAMIMWELWYSKDLSLYASREIQCGLQDAIKGEWRPSLTIVHCPHRFWSDLMQNCWNQNPDGRPTASQIEQRVCPTTDYLHCP